MAGDLCHYSPSMNEWNIQSRAHLCAACTQPFADRQPYHTLLCAEKAELLVRLDICDECWQSRFGDRSRERKGFVSHWQGVYEVPPAVAPEAIQKDTAETLLRKLIQQNDPRYAPAAYILAVMLERKRILRVKEQLKREGQRVFVYEQPKTGDIFVITDPDLHLNQLQSVQQDVAQLLEHGLPPAAAPAGETPVPATPPEPAAPGAPAADSPAETVAGNEAATEPPVAAH
jgi:hypothetical protein